MKRLYIKNFGKERKRKLWINAKNRSRLGGRKRSPEEAAAADDDDEEFISGGCGVTGEMIVNDRVRAAHVAACKVASTVDATIRMTIDNASTTRFELNASHFVRLTDGSIQRYCYLPETQTYFRCGVIDNFVDSVFVLELLQLPLIVDAVKLDYCLQNMQGGPIDMIYLNGKCSESDYDINAAKKLAASRVTSSSILTSLRRLNVDSYPNPDKITSLIADAILPDMCTRELERRERVRQSKLPVILVGCGPFTQPGVMSDLDINFTFSLWGTEVESLIKDSREHVNTDMMAIRFDNFLHALLKNYNKLTLKMADFNALAVQYIQDEVPHYEDQVVEPLHLAKLGKKALCFSEVNFAELARRARCETMELQEQHLHFTKDETDFRAFKETLVNRFSDEFDTEKERKCIDAKTVCALLKVMKYVHSPHVVKLEFESCIFGGSYGALDELVLSDNVTLKSMTLNRCAFPSTAAFALLLGMISCESIFIDNMNLAYFLDLDVCANINPNIVECRWTKNRNPMVLFATANAKSELFPQCKAYRGIRYMEEELLYPYLVACMMTRYAVIKDRSHRVDPIMLTNIAKCIPVGVSFPIDLGVAMDRVKQQPNSKCSKLLDEVWVVKNTSSFTIQDEIHMVYGAQKNERVVELVESSKPDRAAVCYHFFVNFGGPDNMYVTGSKPELYNIDPREFSQIHPNRVTLLNPHTWMFPNCQVIVQEMLRDARDVRIATTERGLFETGALEVVCDCIAACKLIGRISFNVYNEEEAYQSVLESRVHKLLETMNTGCLYTIDAYFNGRPTLSRDIMDLQRVYNRIPSVISVEGTVPTSKPFMSTVLNYLAGCRGSCECDMSEPLLRTIKEVLYFYHGEGDTWYYRYLDELSNGEYSPLWKDAMLNCTMALTDTVDVCNGLIYGMMFNIECGEYEMLDVLRRVCPKATYADLRGVFRLSNVMNIVQKLLVGCEM